MIGNDEAGLKLIQTVDCSLVSSCLFFILVNTLTGSKWSMWLKFVYGEHFAGGATMVLGILVN